MNHATHSTEIAPLRADLTGEAATRQFLLDVMTTAIEGGIGYWAEVKEVTRDAELNVLSFSVRDDGDGDPNNREKDEWTHITPFQISEAIAKMLTGNTKVATRIVGQFVGFPHCIDNCDYDAEGADCAVQIAVFGQVVFS